MNTNVTFGKRLALGAMIVTTAIVVLTLSCQTILAQNACQDACTNINNQLAALKAERAAFQNDLQSAAPGEKSFLTNQIRKLNDKIAVKASEYKNCEQTHGGKPDLNATFSGKAIMTTNNSDAEGPFTAKLLNDKTLRGVFPHWCHNSFWITKFLPIVVGPYSTPVGDNTTTVTLVNESSSIVDPSTGKVEMTLKLHFHHSLDVAGDSELVITVSTEAAGGKRRRSNGAIALAGKAIFQDGYLRGDSCHLFIGGTLKPKP